MIKTVMTVNGRKTVLLGLSFGNLRQLITEPLDTYIPVDGRFLGIDHDIWIMSGATEADMEELLARVPHDEHA